MAAREQRQSLEPQPDLLRFLGPIDQETKTPGEGTGSFSLCDPRGIRAASRIREGGSLIRSY